MAFVPPSNETELAKGMYNEAAYLVKRLNDLQSRIQTMRINPLMWNIEAGVFNYEIWFADLISLLNEAWSKLTVDEKKEADRMKEIIQRYMREMPPYKKIYIASKGTSEKVLNTKNWERFNDAMDIFERHVKGYLDAHGLSNPDTEGEGLF